MRPQSGILASSLFLSIFSLLYSLTGAHTRTKDPEGVCVVFHPKPLALTMGVAAVLVFADGEVEFLAFVELAPLLLTRMLLVGAGVASRRSLT